MTLSVRQAASWRDDGYLVFPGFFDEPEVRVVTAVRHGVPEAPPRPLFERIKRLVFNRD